MRKYLLIILIIICTTIVISSIVFAEIAEQYPSGLEILINNLRNTFNFQTFSVVGDSRTCGISGGNPNQEWAIQSGQTFIKSASETASICGSGGGLYDFFTNGWTPYKEYKDAINTQCGTGPCNIQLYCCPKAECTSSSDCSGGTCNTVTCTIISGTSGYSCPGETRIPYYTDHYSYCTQTTTMTCYYRDGDTCGLRTYDKSLFPNSCESYTYAGGKLYSSLPTCQGQLGSCISDSECSAIGKVCQSGTCVTLCTDTSWSPDTSTVCSGTSFTQTSNCGKTRTSAGTKDCGTQTCLLENCHIWCPTGTTKDTSKTCTIGICCTSPQTNQTNQTNKQVGESCSSDLECITGHCDKTGWFGLGGYKCSPTPWNEIKKVAATREQISQMTTTDALKIACMSNEECLIYNSNFTSKCIPISSLINDGTIQFSQSSFFERSQEVIGTTAGGAAIGGILGIGFCVTAGTATAISWGVTAPIAAAVCASAISGGAIIGGAAGFSLTSFSEKDPITSKLNAGDANAVGLCVVEQEALYCKYTSWAAFIPITKNKCNDGLIIIIAGLVIILLLLFRR